MGKQNNFAISARPLISLWKNANLGLMALVVGSGFVGLSSGEACAQQAHPPSICAQATRDNFRVAGAHQLYMTCAALQLACSFKVPQASVRECVETALRQGAGAGGGDVGSRYLKSLVDPPSQRVADNRVAGYSITVTPDLPMTPSSPHGCPDVQDGYPNVNPFEVINLSRHFDPDTDDSDRFPRDEFRSYPGDKITIEKVHRNGRGIDDWYLIKSEALGPWANIGALFRSALGGATYTGIDEPFEGWITRREFDLTVPHICASE